MRPAAAPRGSKKKKRIGLDSAPHLPGSEAPPPVRPEGLHAFAEGLQSF